MLTKNKPGPKKYTMDAQTIALLLIIGLAAGILSGLVGVGGGIIIVPGLVLLLGFSQQQAQGTSLGLLLLPIGILAVFNYYNKGFIDVKVIGVMAIAFMLGGWVGSKLALSLPEVTIKRILAVVLFYTAFKMLNWDAAIIKWVRGIFN
jgi:uncharacterized membrane protein YfcA